MSQHLNFMLEHLKMSNRRSGNNTTTSSPSPCPSAGVDVPPVQCRVASEGGGGGEKSPISALIHRFSSSSAWATKAAAEEVDCASAVASGSGPVVATIEPSGVSCGGTGKVNNGSNKWSGQSTLHPHPPARDSSGSPSASRKGSMTSNGHPLHAPRKMSADFRLHHRDLSNEENGKHLGHKPARVKNLANKTEAYDMLYHKTVEKVRRAWEEVSASLDAAEIPLEGRGGALLLRGSLPPT